MKLINFTEFSSSIISLFLIVFQIITWNFDNFHWTVTHNHSAVTHRHCCCCRTNCYSLGIILSRTVNGKELLTYSPCNRHGKCPPTFFQSQPNSFSCHSIYVKDNFYLVFSSKKVGYQKL